MTFKCLKVHLLSGFCFKSFWSFEKFESMVTFFDKNAETSDELLEILICLQKAPPKVTIVCIQI